MDKITIEAVTLEGEANHKSAGGSQFPHISNQKTTSKDGHKIKNCAAAI